MRTVSCPTAGVNAPVELVWMLLTAPAGWGDFFDIRVAAIDPPGRAAVGQTVRGESGPRFLRLKVALQYAEIDAAHYRLGLRVRLPFGVTVREDLNCVPLERNRCHVAYRCDFGFPAGWRGAMARLMMRRKLASGPADSLSRLKRVAERLQANS